MPKTFGIPVIALALSLGIMGLSVGAVDKTKNDAIQTVERTPVALVKLSTEQASRLNSRHGRKFALVDGFDPKFLKVKAESPTELRIVATRAGWCQMSITYDDRQTERLVFVVDEAEQK